MSRKQEERRGAFNRQRRNNLRFADTGPRIVNGRSFDERLLAVKDRGKALKGAGLALAGSLSNVPGLGGASQGALLGSFGGPAGAALGAAIGGVVELTGATAQYANAAAIAAAEQGKFNTALRGITSGNDYVTALESIQQLSEDFIQDVGTTTQQFTKLTAATTANGISVEETAEVYQGLAAANLALGGDAERLQGILLATGQVFSKSKVQAEELRGQIGERLPVPLPCLPSRSARHPPSWTRRWKGVKSRSRTLSNSPSPCLSSTERTPRLSVTAQPMPVRDWKNH